MDADFSYHMGGALYIPQKRAPSPEQVTSRTLPESVPSSTTDLSPVNTPDPIPSAARKNGDIVEESDQSSLYKDEDGNSSGSTGSAEYTRDDSEPLSESSRPLKRGRQEEEYSSEQETSNTVPRSNKRSKQSNSNKKWDRRLEELKEFKAKHGHCRLPQSCGSLCQWLIDQRNVSLNPMSPRHLQDVSERERRTKELESVLGASLCDGRIPKGTPRARYWNARLEELKEFKAKHGHCRLPTSSGSLYGWLNHQRNIPLNPNAPKCLKDASERERRTKELESVLGAGLWDGPNQRTTEASNWDARLEELKKFRAKHGHCRLPKACGSLYDWLSNQRNKHLNPKSPSHLQDASERERRTKELESVLGAGLLDGRNQQRAIEESTLDTHLEEGKKFQAKHH